MRLTSFTDFGLRMLMRMAGDPSRAFSSAELAADPVSYTHLDVYKRQVKYNSASINSSLDKYQVANGC